MFLLFVDFAACVANGSLVFGRFTFGSFDAVFGRLSCV
jgi:hypothetical protein